MSHRRILLLGVISFTLAGCAKTPDAADAPGFLSAWRQFLELDNSTPAGEPVVSRPASPRASSAALGADIAEVTEQIRRLFGDAGTYLEGFPQAEDGYRNIPTRFREQVAKIEENKAKADPDTVRRRLTQISSQVVEALDRQHSRFGTLQDTFTQRMDALMKRLPELEQKCAKVQAEAAGSEDARACTGFQDADAMIKTRAEPVATGFAHLEGVYKEVNQNLEELRAQTLSAANGK